VLNAINPFQAKFNLKTIMRKNSGLVNQNYHVYDISLDYFFKAEDVVKLDEDMGKAMEKLTELEREIEILPGLDCAACGAPDCKTLAEDIVNGLAQRTDCIFMLRKEIEELAEKISSLTHELPPVMADEKRSEEKG
ncbi:MAG: (Fe-S)-binding protein, partial [Halanaerobiaceae bacterium]